MLEAWSSSNTAVGDQVVWQNRKEGKLREMFIFLIPRPATVNSFVLYFFIDTEGSAITS